MGKHIGRLVSILSLPFNLRVTRARCTNYMILNQPQNNISIEIKQISNEYRNPFETDSKTNIRFKPVSTGHTVHTGSQMKDFVSHCVWPLEKNSYTVRRKVLYYKVCSYSIHPIDKNIDFYLCAFVLVLRYLL
jgi:hypothetical protein